MIVTIVTTCAREGRGGMMTITGETGFGKSRLIAEVLERCPGMDTLKVQAEPNGADNPFWAFRDPMRRALGIERASAPEMVESLNRTIDEDVAIEIDLGADHFWETCFTSMCPTTTRRQQ